MGILTSQNEKNVKTMTMDLPLTEDNTLAYSVIIMIRTQISLTRTEYQLAKKESKRMGISLAELLRRSLRSLLPYPKDKPWMKYAGDVSSGNPRSSQEIDDVIYGHKE